MGNLADLVSMIPGAGSKFKVSDFDEIKMKKYKAIIQSMTKKERLNPDLIKASNRKRIAAGSGTTIQDVNILLKQFNQSKEMMKQAKNQNLTGIFIPVWNFIFDINAMYSANAVELKKDSNIIFGGIIMKTWFLNFRKFCDQIYLIHQVFYDSRI